MAVIAIGAGFGTLSEIGFALKIGREVIGLKTWEATGPDQVRAPIRAASDAPTAVSLALAAAAEG